MMISRSELSNVLRSYVPQARTVQQGEERSASARPSERQGDTLSLSAQAQEIQRLRAALEQVPDVREDRVREISDAVAQGTYRVEGEKVAQQMLARLLGDKLV